MKYCPGCKGEVLDGERVCSSCGYMLKMGNVESPTVRTYPECIEEIPVEAKVNSNCEYELKNDKVESSTVRTCPECNEEVPTEAKVCLNCGYELKKVKAENTMVRTCPECNEEVLAGVKVCSNCGYKLKKVKVESSTVRTCPECNEEVPAGAKVCSNCGYKLKKKKKFIPILIAAVLLIAVAVGVWFVSDTVIKKLRKPVPFSNMQWDATQAEVIAEYGTPDEEYDNQYYGHIISYDDVEFEGYTGKARYCFNDDKLTSIVFYIPKYDLDTVEYFREYYRSKYGEPDFTNTAGVIWYEELANYGVSASAVGVGCVMCNFGKPTEE